MKGGGFSDKCLHGRFAAFYFGAIDQSRLNGFKKGYGLWCV